MTYVFDLDGTLCSGSDYDTSTPIAARVAVVRRLHAAGHRIVIDSARGSVTGVDWLAVTTRQLQEWGVPFHEVRTGVKFYGDVYVDDKGVAADAYFAHP
jgi:hypothetical protein